MSVKLGKRSLVSVLLLSGNNQPYNLLSMTTLLASATLPEEPGLRAVDLEIREMLLAVIQSLVDQPEQVELLYVAEGHEVAFQVRTSPKDAGKVIGKNGRTARAIRMILVGSGMKNDRVYSFDLVHQQRQK